MGLSVINGAGKTTTLKACAGILQFDAGEIMIDGISIKMSRLPARKRWHIFLIILIFMNSCQVYSF